MATQAQIEANRLNARKSTGPRTAEGKQKASQNALKHGLLAQKAVIAGEDPGEFEFYRAQMLGELAPAGAMESVLAERVVSLSWRLRRAERVQNEAFDALLAKDSANPLARLTQSLRPRSASTGSEGESALGRAVVSDFSNARVLDRLLMYERRIEHSLYKSMAELQRLKLMRELEPATEKPTRPVETAAQSAGAAGEEAPCETKPIGGRGDAERPMRGEMPAYSAGRKLSTGPQWHAAPVRGRACDATGSDGRMAGVDRAKRSQCARG